MHLCVCIACVCLSAAYEAEGEQGLVQLLQDGSPGGVAHAAAALSHMAQQEVVRSSILSRGAMRALVEPLSCPDTHTLLHTTQALAALACDADGRADVRHTLTDTHSHTHI